MGQEEPSQIVDLESKFVAVGALLPLVLEDPGVVHQNVEPGLVAQDRVRHTIDAGQDREVRHIESRPRTARRSDLRHHSFGAGAVSPMHEERGPALRQGDRLPAPEPIGGACDQHDLAGQIVWYGRRSIRSPGRLVRAAWGMARIWELTL